MQTYSTCKDVRENGQGIAMSDPRNPVRGMSQGDSCSTISSTTTVQSRKRRYREPAFTASIAAAATQNIPSLVSHVTGSRLPTLLNVCLHLCCCPPAAFAMAACLSASLRCSSACDSRSRRLSASVWHTSNVDCRSDIRASAAS